VNDAPVAANDSYSTDQDTELVVEAPGVLGNDTDVEGDDLTAVLESGPSNGSLTLNADGSFSYTPDAGFSGTDSFTYRASDGDLLSEPATVTIAVAQVNQAPVAVDDSYEVDEDQVLSVVAPGVLDNDTDVDGDSLTAVLVSGVSNGSLTFNSDGSFTYTPNADFNGSDSFTYVATDGALDSNLATVTITVNAVNDAPVIDPVAPQSVFEGSELVVTVTATDPDGDVLTYSLDDPPTGATIDPLTGVFRWTPADGPDDSTSITVRVTDNGDPSLFATVTFDVTVTNVAPTIALTGAATVTVGETYTLTLGTVTDPGTDTVSSYIVNWGDGSIGTFDAAGDVTHIYATVGDYTITVDLVDEDGTHVAAGTLAVTVTAVVVVNQPPVIESVGPQTIAEGSELVLTIVASDPNNDSLTYSLDAAPTGATIDAATGVFRWTPADGPDDSTGITVRVTDNGDPALSATVTFDVTVTNVAPTIALTGAPVANQGQSYDPGLGAVTDPGDDTVTSYIVHWGDGTSDTYADPGAASHAYDTPGVYQIVVDLVDEDGTHTAAGALEVRVRPDRLLSIPSVPGSRFSLVVVPVQVDIGDEIAGVELVISYDPALFFPLSVTPGMLLSGFTGTVDLGTAGLIVISLSSSNPIAAGESNVTLVEIVFFVLRKDSGPIDLQFARLVTLDGAELALEVTPQAGADATDGEIVVAKNNGRGRGRPGTGDAQQTTVTLVDAGAATVQSSEPSLAESEPAGLQTVEPTDAESGIAVSDATEQDRDGDPGQPTLYAPSLLADDPAGENETTPWPGDAWWESFEEGGLPERAVTPLEFIRGFVIAAPRTSLNRFPE
jgi:VCBS repeat-containing protein